MATQISLLSAEDLYELPSDRRCELINGVVVDLAPPGFEHGDIQITIGSTLMNYVRPRQLGRVVVEAGFILRRNPDTVRGPDVAFIRADRLTTGRRPRGFWVGAPDLVAEVISPGDTPAEVETKLREWLEAGARLVWLVYPETRSVQVVRSPLDRERLGAEETLDGGDVLPGFTCRVAELFE